MEKFGKRLLNLFCFEPGFVNVNNGSYGSPPKIVIEKMKEYIDKMEENPEKWIRLEIGERIKEVRKAVAKYVNAPTENLVLVQNASDGINSVFKSIISLYNQKNSHTTSNSASKPKMLMLDINYSSAKNTARYLSDLGQAETVDLVVDKRMLNSGEEFLAKLESLIKRNNGIRIACIDHIPSVPASILPVKEITQLLRKYNILSFIDGAHTLGQIPLNIADINPDFYISNLHKWGNNPKSCCFLYAKDDVKDLLTPTIVSSEFLHKFPEDFAYTGTKDYSSFITFPHALKFRQQFGEEELISYNRNLAWEAGEMIAKMWETEVLIEDKSKVPAMVNVRIPYVEESQYSQINPPLPVQAVKLTLRKYNTYIVVFKFNDGNYYARFSAQIYNELSDFKYAASNYLKVLKHLKGERKNLITSNNIPTMKSKF